MNFYKITGSKSESSRTLIGYRTKGACLYNSIMVTWAGGGGGACSHFKINTSEMAENASKFH